MAIWFLLQSSIQMASLAQPAAAATTSLPQSPREEVLVPDIEPQTCAPAVPCLRSISVSGFKCFRDRTTCGPFPSGAITAVVGPNGCGKSVIGEAVAFALGGNSRMLRAQNWASLCSQYKGPGAPPTKVAVALDLERCGRKVSEIQVERTIHSGSSARTRVAVMQAGGAVQWKDVSQAELHALLLPLGINTKAIDRYVVTQSRQAIDVQEPLKLLQHLECLLGTAHLAEEIQAQERLARDAKVSIQQQQDEYDRLQEVRKTFVPELAKWHAYRKLLAELQDRRQQVLERKAKLLEAKVQLSKDAAGKLQDKESCLRGLCETTQKALQELQAEKDALDRQAQALAARLKAARKQASSAQADAAHALTKLREAQEAAEASARLQALAVKRAAALKAKCAAAAAAESAAAEAVKEGEQRLERLTRQEGQLAAALSNRDAEESGRGGAPGKAGMKRGKQQQQQGQRQGREVEEDGDEGVQLAADLVSKEGELKEAQRLHTRLQRELQVASAQLDSTQRAHDKQLAALRETEAANSAHAEAAAQAASDVAALDSELQQLKAKLATLCQEQVEAMVELQRAEEALQALDHSGPPGAGQVQTAASRGAGRGGASSSGSRWQAHNDTILRLYSGDTGGASAGRGAVQAAVQPGSFHGRLCNLLFVSDASAMTAVNAALSEVCNPATTLVASDRATAFKVVAAFKTVGSVSCKVLEELPAAPTAGPFSPEPYIQQQQQQQQQRQSIGLPGGLSGVPLTAVLAADPNVPNAERLVHSMLGGWAMVADRQAALHVMSAQQQQRQLGKAGARGWNLVTPSGQVFKADGEIVVKLVEGPGQGGGRGPVLPTQGDEFGLGTSVKVIGKREEGAGSGVGTGAATVEAEAQQRTAAASTAAAAAAAAEWQRNREAAAQRVAQLRVRCTKAEEAVSSGEAAVRRLSSQLSAARSRHTSESRAASGSKAMAAAIRRDMARAGRLPLEQGAAGAGGRSGTQGQEQGQGQGERPISFLEAVRERVGQLTAQVQAAKEQLEACSAAAAAARQVAAAAAAASAKAGRASGPGSAAVNLPAVRRQLKDAGRQLAKAREELAARRREVERLQQQQLQEQSRASEGTAQQKGRGPAEDIAKLKKAHAQALVQAEKCEEAVEGLEAEVGRVAEQGRDLNSSLAQSRERLEVLQGQAAEVKAEGQRLVQEGERLEGGLAGVREELCALEAEMRARREEEGEKQVQQGTDMQVQVKKEDLEQGTGNGRRMRRRVILDDSSESDGGASSSASGSSRSEGSDCKEEQEEMVVKTRVQHRIQGRKGRAAQRAKDKGNLEDDGEDSMPVGRKGRRGGAAAPAAAKAARQASGKAQAAFPAGSLSKEEAWVAAGEAAVRDQQSELDRLRMGINTAALQEDILAIQALERVHAELAQQEQHLAAATAAAEKLVDDRYGLLSHALATINGELSRVYQFLTGWLGDAYLQFTADRRLLFVSGVTFNVRPDQHRWRPFASLSGGQQALSTLALAFAMQAAFPSPFHFFDEVDAALDTLNAERVAEYMLLRSRGLAPVRPGTETPTEGPASEGAPRAGPGSSVGKDGKQRSSHTQYIVVSHRPQVFEKAACLVGVYGHRASSLAVTAMMDDAPAAA